MKHLTSILNVASLTLVLALSISCAQPAKDGRTDTYSSGEMTFYCDESFSPIITEEIDVFEATYPKAHVKPVYTTENAAMDSLMKQKCHMSVAGRTFTQNEINYVKGLGYQPISLPIGYDGLAFIINRNNLDSCLTVQNVKDILTGAKTQWKEIFPKSKLGEIKVVFDNEESAATRYACDSILGGKQINSPNIMAAKNSVQVIDYVEKTDNSIGIIGSNWLNDQRDTTNVTFKKNITVVSISKMDIATPSNSWKPYQYYLLDGRYPFARTVYALVVDPRRGRMSLPWGFANFLQSPQGQRVILKSALLPYLADLNIRDVRVDDGSED